MIYHEFNHLVLLIDTNPLPNFVVADYFLQNNEQLQFIWLLHSEKNRLQAGTHEQAKNLEALLRKRWKDNHANLSFPLEKISLADVNNATTILREIETKMLNGWQSNSSFHLNYTGGTETMATHVYKRLQDLGKRGQHQFSYLDANNFRLVVDDYGIERFVDDDDIECDDLRKKVQIPFEDLIALHGFQRINSDKEIDCAAAQLAYETFLNVERKTMEPKEGNDFEAYIFSRLNDKLKPRKNIDVFRNSLIKKPNSATRHDLGVMVLHGYHLTAISCIARSDKDSCKFRGLEIILRSRQIGGNEARTILITRSNRNLTKVLQAELAYEAGGLDNILVLGIDDLRQEDIYLRKIEKFFKIPEYLSR